MAADTRVDAKFGEDVLLREKVQTRKTVPKTRETLINRLLARMLGAAAIISCCTFGTTALALPSCPADPLSSPKSSVLYLYYPTAADATFPNWLDGGVPTSPLAAFNIADLDPGIGSATTLRANVQQLVEAGYCEFDVEVRTTTSKPVPAEPRWQIVGIGSDNTGTGLVGIAQAVDTNDSDAQDYARFWVQALATFAGASLTGANSTPERWATGLADLIAHESGHNYGGTHAGGVAVAGEDPTPNHFMTNPALGATGSSIVDDFNHFSNATYEVLGHNIGLNAKTAANWDFTNPNSSNADSLVITILSNAPTLTIGWWFNGSLSPWQNPTVTDTGTTQSYRGTTYKVFNLTFSSPKSWTGGGNGVVPPDTKFHVGATFTQPDPKVVVKATLRNGGSDLALHPRIFDFNAEFSFSGAFLTFANADPGAGTFIIRNLRIMYSPRMIDINTMIPGAVPMGLDGQRAALYQRREERGRGNISPPSEIQKRTIRVGKEPVRIPFAAYNDRRHIDITYTAKDCPPGSIGASRFGPPGVAEYCVKGTHLSLFPATYVYVSAVMVDPAVKHWDAKTEKFIVGAVETPVFYQIAGVVPDANRNGVDDLLDIRTKHSTDRDRNGIPDEAQREYKPGDAYPVVRRQPVR